MGDDIVAAVGGSRLPAGRFRVARGSEVSPGPSRSGRGYFVCVEEPGPGAYFSFQPL